MKTTYAIFNQDTMLPEYFDTLEEVQKKRSDNLITYPHFPEQIFDIAIIQENDDGTVTEFKYVEE